MAAGTLLPLPWWSPLDDNGIIMDGAKLYFYLSGTSTPADVYHDADLSSAWTFPAVADSSGRIVVYMDPSVGNLKLIVTDADDVPVGPTVDPLSPTNAGSAGLGEVFVFGSNSSASITQNSYASGATYDKIQPGSSPWPVDPATLNGTYVIEVVGLMVTSGTMTVALVNLTDGAPDTPIAEAEVDSLTGETSQSAAITFPAGGSVKQFALKPKVSANEGFLIGARVVRTA